MERVAMRKAATAELGAREVTVGLQVVGQAGMAGMGATAAVQPRVGRAMEAQAGPSMVPVDRLEPWVLLSPAAPGRGVQVVPEPHPEWGVQSELTGQEQAAAQGRLARGEDHAEGCIESGHQTPPPRPLSPRPAKIPHNGLSSLTIGW